MLRAVRATCKCYGIATAVCCCGVVAVMGAVAVDAGWRQAGDCGVWWGLVGFGGVYARRCGDESEEQFRRTNYSSVN